MAATREAARTLGHTYFFSGRACKRGHAAARYVSTPVCVECVRLKYAENKDSIISKLKESYHADPAKYREKEIARYKENPKRYWAKNVYKNVKKRATELGLPFDLTRRYIEGIIPDTCPVFDTPFTFYGNQKMKGTSASLDRLKPELGYVEGNVRVISIKANNIKSNATAKDVAKVAQWMYEQGL
jgi:hypothetical protein